jgi:hypothetical protein
MCGGSRARVYIGTGAQRRNPRQRGPRPRRTPESVTTAHDPGATRTGSLWPVRQGLGQTLGFPVQQKDKLGSEAQFRKPRCARIVTCRVVSSRDETSKRGGGGARVWHFSSHLLTKWCNTLPYMLVYISRNISCGTKLSSHPLPLYSQKLGLYVTWAHTHGLWDF